MSLYSVSPKGIARIDCEYHIACRLVFLSGAICAAKRFVARYVHQNDFLQGQHGGEMHGGAPYRLARKKSRGGFTNAVFTHTPTQAHVVARYLLRNQV